MSEIIKKQKKKSKKQHKTVIVASILEFWVEAQQNHESLTTTVNKVNAALRKKKVKILHLDIMDGKFVPETGLSSAFVKKLAWKKKCNAHFMVVDYKKYLKEYIDLADTFFVHVEVLQPDFEQTIIEVHKQHKKIGIAINPDTPLDQIPYLDKIDDVLIMSVYPGKPGQKFIEGSIEKIHALSLIRNKRKLHFMIEVDGGINDVLQKECGAAGAQRVEMGSWLFRDVE